MDIAVIGTGYVGLPAGTGLAKHSHQVTCVDIDEEKVEKINNGECPIFEKDLPELLEEVTSKGSLEATTDIKTAVRNADVVLLAVGTPMDEEGNINLDYIKQASKDVAEGMKEREGYQTIVVKSTVVPGTTDNEVVPVLEESGKKAGKDFGVCMNPEFLREGTAVSDFLEPDRIVIGEFDERSGEQLEEMYSEFDAPIMRTGLKEAELIKYASNSLLATKISFINEIGNLCKELSIDVYEVADGVGMDHRIKRDFLNSGDGFGGSCFPKDVRALIRFMEKNNTEPRLLQSTIDVNVDQKTKLVELLENRVEDLPGKTVTVLGLSFKPGTDDVRKSPAIPIIQELKDKGVNVKAYDPEAIENMKQKHHPDIHYCETRTQALKNSDAALLVTDWPEFDEITRKELKQMNNPVILEGMRPDYELDKENTEGVTWP